MTGSHKFSYANLERLRPFKARLRIGLNRLDTLESQKLNEFVRRLRSKPFLLSFPKGVTLSSTYA